LTQYLYQFLHPDLPPCHKIPPRYLIWRILQPCSEKVGNSFETNWGFILKPTGDLF